MAMTESDSEDDLSDNDDATDEMNEDDDDDFCEFEDIGRLTDVRDSILGRKAAGVSKIPSETIPVDYSIRLAINPNSQSSATSDSSKPMIDDSLRMYLNAPPLVRRIANTNKACLSIDPTTDESQSNTLSTSELYVGNIDHDAKWYELRDWFIGRGHGVSRVIVKSNRVCRTSSFSCAENTVENNHLF